MVKKLVYKKPATLETAALTFETTVTLAPSGGAASRVILSLVYLRVRPVSRVRIL